MKRQIIKLAGIAGAIGPVLFASVLVALSFLEYDFMVGIGWRPVADPSGAWPSGLALGPYGAFQVANFVLSGLLLCLFALGLHLKLSTGRGPVLLFVAGVAMALMGFLTDPIERSGHRSAHGLIHDSAFVVFVVAFMAALLWLCWTLRGEARWQGHATYTLVTAMVAALLLPLPGVAYYLFLVVLLAWIEITVIRLWRTP